MNPTFYKITVCQIITLFGNAALRFALPLYLLRRTDSATLFQILLFTAIQAHAPTGQTGRFMSLITVCACLTQPVRAGGVRAFVRPLCCPAQCRAFYGGGCLDFYKPCCIAYFQKSRFFFKIMNASLPIY